MTSKSRRPLVIYAAVFAVALAGSGAAVWLAARLFPTRPAYAPAPHEVPLTLNNLYAPADHTRLIGIGTVLQNGQPISNADLDWAIGLLKRGPVVDTPGTRADFAIRTMSQLLVGRKQKRLPPKQAHRLAQAVLPIADDPPAGEREPVEGIQAMAVSAQLTAVTLLGSLDDKAAEVKLEQLAKSSPTPAVRQNAGAFVARQKARHGK